MVAWSRFERGQALILVALSFVGLVAFLGLAVDAGILFTQVGNLRRAVDGADLAAADQFRQGRDVPQLTAAATESVNLNGLNPGTAVVDTCASGASLCTNPPRKLVRVSASLPVSFVFLPIVGLDSVTIHANAVSEAASLDLVMVIDPSSSMAFDNSAPAMRDPNQCNPVRQCHPFEEVRAAQWLGLC
jgi:uncharacterized membrane protein